MRSVRWSKKSLIDFDEAQAYIAQENPFVAQAVAGRIVQAGEETGSQESKISNTA